MTQSDTYRKRADMSIWVVACYFAGGEEEEDDDDGDDVDGGDSSGPGKSKKKSKPTFLRIYFSFKQTSL